MNHIREPINSITHFIGMLGALLAIPFVLPKAHGTIQVLSMIIFLLGLVGLYGTSATYHAIKKAPEIIAKWRKADHMMIYILIAATYTPICLISLKGPVGYTLLAAVWILSILGMVMKIFWINIPRKVYTGLYVLLGWVAIFAIQPIYQAVGVNGLLLLVGGGIAYTLGAVFYARKSRIKIWKFGFHEIFHLFIMLGSFLHFAMIYLYVLA